MDDQVAEYLERLDIETIKPISRDVWESDELLAVKADRTVGEYCWTVTPLTSRIVFALNLDALRVTYVDADLWFRASPAPIFEEFSNSEKSVLITEHGYSPDVDASATAGRYCVQFMTFKRTVSDPIVEWWSNQCLIWCFNRHEDGKFGDQKYLDDWTERFHGDVHVLAQRSLIQGPWSSRRFPYSEAVAYHFHGLRLIRGGRVYLGNYQLTEPLIDNVYDAYLADLKIELDRSAISPPVRAAEWRELLWPIRRVRRKLQIYWRTRPFRKVPKGNW